VSLLLVTLVILIASAVGVAAERRRGRAAQRLADHALLFALYGVLPFVVFFNVIRLNVTGDVVAGLGLAWAALLST
jgi:nitrogen fixation/metabolism regulation signal transduction histidine kinase